MSLACMWAPMGSAQKEWRETLPSLSDDTEGSGEGRLMRPKFISAMYFEGRILMFEEYGDVYEYYPGRGNPTWTLLSTSPWPENRPYDEPAKIVEREHE